MPNETKKGKKVTGRNTTRNRMRSRKRKGGSRATTTDSSETDSPKDVVLAVMLSGLYVQYSRIEPQITDTQLPGTASGAEFICC